MSGVNVTVETSTDNQIIEVSYDGQETVQPPLTLAEHLAKQAGKINFDEVDQDATSGLAEQEDGGAESTTGDDDDEEEEEDKPAVWPWESTRNKLRDALTELSVLADVISVATKPCGVDIQVGGAGAGLFLDSQGTQG